MDPAALQYAQIMEPARTPGSDRQKRLEAAIGERVRHINSGNYRRNTEFILRDVFLDFLETSDKIDDPPTYVAEVTVEHCKHYAEYLRNRVYDPDDKLSGASASEDGMYYTVVRAFFNVCIDEEWRVKNPARPNRVKRVLPEDTDKPDRQFWSQEARAELLEYINQEVEAGIGEAGSLRRHPEAIILYRNRALVATLAFAGVRGGEILASTDDPLRNGLRWGDVDLDNDVMTVLGKSRDREPVGLPERVVEYLGRLKRIMQPEGDDWPVFPSSHAPSHSASVRDGLEAQGYDAEEREDILDPASLWEVSYEYGVAPPSLSTNGGRSLMQRLCADAGIDVDGEYLKPHGARRQLGDEIYEVNPAKAQDTLRHQNIGVTHDSYREKQAAETAKSIEDIVDGAGGGS